MTILIFIEILSIILVFAEGVYVFSKWRTRLQGQFFLYCVVILINNTGYLMQMIAKNQEGYLTALKMSYLGRVWISFSLMLFTLNICQISYKKWMTFFMAGIHAITFVMVATCEHHTLYYSKMVYETDSIFPYFKCEHGIWYNIFFALQIAYIVIGITCLVRKAVKEKNIRRKKLSSLVAISLSVEAVFYIVQITGISGAYDITNLGYTIGTVIMYVAIFKYDMIDNLEIVRDYLLDEVDEAIIVCGQNDRLEYINKKAEEIALLYNSREEMLLQFQQKAETGDYVFIEDRVYNVVREIIKHRDQVTGFQYLITDDTEQYNHMKELKMQKEEAEEANASKSRFLSIVSHEIRTPMNAVVGMTELLLKEPENLNDKQTRYLNNMKNSGKALVMIVNDILDQSKIEAGKMELVEEIYDLRSMTEDVEMIIVERIGNRPISFTREIDNAIPQTLKGDSLRIRQILINICNNAVKFTNSGFIKLNISCVDTKDNQMNLRFSIKDSGQGIKKEDLNKLGEAFSQVDVAKNHGKEGTGLGLSISKDFIELMGGRLKVESVYGSGTEFYFEIKQEIPKQSVLNLDEQDKSVQPLSKQAWQQEIKLLCPNVKILAVDDIELNLEIFGALLEETEAKIELVNSAYQALEKIKNEDFDIVFTDNMMPEMDGIELTEKIRWSGYKMPIIVMSGEDSEDTRERFYKAGVNDFAYKPVIENNLKELIAKWLPEKCTLK